MKKLALIATIVLGLSMTTFADPYGGGLFQRGTFEEQTAGGWRTDDPTPALPAHGQSTDQNAPLGTGIAVLLGLGAAYLVGKKRREE